VLRWFIWKTNSESIITINRLLYFLCPLCLPLKSGGGRAKWFIWKTNSENISTIYRPLYFLYPLCLPLKSGGGRAKMVYLKNQ
jgi:hypothetical protein